MVPIAERLMGKGVEVAIFDKELAGANLHGANAAFALSTIPHLRDLVTDDLGSVVADADYVVINHRHHDGFDWERELDHSVPVLDLLGVDELGSRTAYEGVYWRRRPGTITAGVQA